MPTAILLLLLVLAIALLIALAFPQGRTFLSDYIGRFRRRAPPTPPKSVVLDELGGETPILDKPEPRFRSQTERLRAAFQRKRIREMIRRYELRDAIGGSQRLLVSLLIILIALIALWRLPALLPNRLDRFTVLVAPFNERDGSIGQTGREVANQLAQLLASDPAGRIRAQTIAAPPADLDAALELMRREGADALIWGTITPGGMLNQESLTPMLAYHPTGAFAPLAWDGYNGRFAMPESYTIADRPLNGQVVLPGLIGALADYAAGRVDSAFDTLGALLQNTPALVGTLPHAVRGNILWARGDYGPAAAEYRQALDETTREGDQPLRDGRPLLSNNLGAIQQDAGDPAATATFAQTIGLLAGRDLGALRYNLGIGFLHAGRSAEAATSLDIARQLMPASTTLLLNLSEAYRGDGQLAQARAALNAAQELANDETQATSAALRALLGSRLRGGIAAQRALLNLAEYLQAKGPLLWELQAADQLDARTINDVRSDLAAAVRETRDLAQGWNRRSAAEDAAENHLGGLLAIHQFRRASEQLASRRLWEDAVNVELARVQGVVPPSGIAGLWRRLVSGRTALGQSRDDLKLLLDTPPNSADEALLYGQALLLTDGSASAATVFDQAAADYPASPELPYGQALAAQADGKDQRAIDLLARAIRLDERYFPARVKLAQIAEANGEWPIAAEQRSWLAQARPSPEQTLKLAAALRQTDADHYAEAERLLLGIANNPQLEEHEKVPALTELGRLYYDTQDGAAARTVLDRAQRAAPRDPAVAYELGRVLAAQGQVDAAAAQFQRAIDNDPEPVQAHLALANFYHDRAAALAEQYQTAAQSGATNVEELRGQVNRYATNINAADEQYRAALTAGASKPSDLKLIGHRLLDSGEYDAAATAYDRLAKLTPDDPEAYHGLARAYTQLGRLDTAQTAEQKALALSNGAYPEALSGLGDIALARGRPDEAIQQYNAALQQDPNLAAAYIGLGHVSAAAGNWAVAAGHFRSAISHDSGSAAAHFSLGEALLEQRDVAGAIAEYQQAITLRRDYAEAYYGLARAQVAGGQSDAAQASLTAAITIRPNYDRAWLEQGKLYEQLGRDASALDAYDHAILANAKLAEARYRRGLLYTRQDNMSNAASDLEAATSAQANFPEAHYWLGRVYLAQNRAQAARDEFKTAVDLLNGNYPDARFYQGIAEEQLGQRSEAAASFQSALAQSDNSVWASDARAALARLGQP